MAEPSARRAGPIDPRLLRAVPALRRAMAGLAGLSLVASLATVAQAMALSGLVAAVLVRHQGPAGVRGYLAVLVTAMAVRAGAAGAGEWLAQSTSLHVRSCLRQRLLEAVGRIGGGNLSALDRDRIAAASTTGIDSLDGYVTRALPAVVAAAVVPPVVLAAIGLTNWLALLLLLITLPLVPVFMVLVGLATKRHMDRRWAQMARLSGHFLDLLEGLTTLKIYGRSQAQVRSVRDGTERLRRQTIATLRVAFASGLVLDLLATLSVALVAVTLGLRLDRGRVGLGAALTVLLLAPEVFAPLRAVGAQHHATEDGRTVIDTVMELVEREGAAAPPAQYAPVPFVLRPDADGVVARLENVDVVRSGRDRPVFTGAQVELRAGTLTVLTGASGAGKTTLLSVLLGQVEPAGGSVTVGPDRRARPDGRRWLANVAWVPQRPRPTGPDVAAEVRLGDPYLGDRELQAVLTRCAAPPADTPLGEDGTAISAGQRRRVALARAVARVDRVARTGGVPLVLLDEPTEDLDPATSAVVLSVIADLASWGAVVVATHDPAVLALADVDVAVAGGHTASRPLAGHAALSNSSLSGGWLPDPGRREETGAGLTRPGHPPVASDATGVLGRWVWRALRGAAGARRSLAWAVGLGSLGGLSGLALTATSVWLICRASQHPNVQALAVAVVGVRTFAISKAFLRYGERLAAHDGALHLLTALRVRVFSALEPLAPAGLGDYRRGDLLRRFTTDVDGAQEALVRAGVPLAGAAATTVGAIVLCALLAPAAAAVLGLGAVVAGVVVPFATRNGAGAASEAVAAAGRRDALAHGLVGGLDELAAFGAVDSRLADIASADQAVTRALRRSVTAAGAGTAAAGLASAVTLAGVLAIGTAAVTGGGLPVVDLGVLAAAVLVAFDALGALPAAFAALNRCAAGLGRVEEVLSRPVPVPEPEVPAPAPATVRALTGCGLRIAPSPGAISVVEGADVAVQAGERVAIVGPSGAGKSTLLTAVLGQLAPTAGTLEISGIRGGGAGPVGDTVSSAITALSGRARPSLVSGSLQGDHVFATTIRDNLRLVAPSATDSDLDRVARRAGLAEFIDSLPDGWSTQAGPDGASLSGGQRQRLLLARALLADPQVLVLDEPTAHLDADTEEAVMADLLDATMGRTVILSTHRAAPLEGCDRVLRLSGGRLSPECAPTAKAEQPQRDSNPCLYLERVVS